MKWGDDTPHIKEYARPIFPDMLNGEGVNEDLFRGVLMERGKRA